MHVRFLFLVCFAQLCLTKEVLEVNMDNLEDVLKQRKAVVLYVTDDSAKCGRLYNKFVVTSQTFANDDVIFGRVTDERIAAGYDITSFPGIVFYEFGSNIPRAYRGDVTAGELSKLVVKTLRGDFRSLELKHAVELTKANYDAIMNVSDQCKLVMIHETDDEDEVEAFEELAETFGNEDAVVMARLDVNNEKKLKKLFTDLGLLPVYYLYANGDKEKRKLDTGLINGDRMVNIINKECGTFRIKDGRLNPLAGLIPVIDDVIDAHGQDLYEIKNIRTLKKKIKKLTKQLSVGIDREMAAFYIDLIEKIEDDKSIEGLDEVRNRIYAEMDTAGPLKMDQLFRKRNVVEKFIDIIGKQLLKSLSGMDMDFDYMGGHNHDKGAHKKLDTHDEL